MMMLTIKTEEFKKKKELVWNIQIHFSLHHSNAMGQNN